MKLWDKEFITGRRACTMVGVAQEVQDQSENQESEKRSLFGQSEKLNTSSTEIGWQRQAPGRSVGSCAPV